MQPILMLAIVGVAAVALGTGFLNNDIELWIQQFGVGAGDVTSPIDHALIDFTIATLPNDDDTFRNVITECIVTPTQAIGIEEDGSLPDGLDAQNHVTCKLTGKDAAGEPNGQIIAEGTAWADFYPAGGAITVSIMTPAGDLEVDVRDVGDVILVAQAETHADSDGNLMGQPAPP